LSYGEYVVGLYDDTSADYPSEMVREYPVIVPYATITFDHRTESTLYGSVTSINDSGWETKNAIIGVYPDEYYDEGTTQALAEGDLVIDYYIDAEDGLNYIGITIGTTYQEFVLRQQLDLNEIDLWV
jgi:hypothetical protein